MRGAPIRPSASERLPREPGARRVDDDDVRGPGAVAELLDRLPDVAGEERRVRDPVQVGVLERARATDSSETSIPQTVSASAASVSPIVPMPQ